MMCGNCVHLDDRKAAVAQRTCGMTFCNQAPIQVGGPATGHPLAEHECEAVHHDR